MVQPLFLGYCLRGLSKIVDKNNLRGVKRNLERKYLLATFLENNANCLSIYFVNEPVSVVVVSTHFTVAVSF